MSAAEFLPPRLNLTALREAPVGCRGCHLWTSATQTVFGEGRKRSRTEARGAAIESDLARFVTATARPSAILRMPTDEARHAARRDLARDLRVVADYLAA